MIPIKQNKTQRTQTNKKPTTQQTNKKQADINFAYPKLETGSRMVGIL